MTDGSTWSRAGATHLFGAWLLSAALHVYIIMPASVLPEVADGLAVSETTAVWLVSAVLASWAVTNFGVGVLVDRVGDRLVVAVGGAVVVAFALAGWVVARDGQFWLLIWTRAGAGVAVGAVWIASTTLVGRLFAVERRGTALGAFTTSAPAGFAVGQIVGPVVTDAAGWPAIFAVGGLLSVATLAVFVSISLLVGSGPEIERSGETSDGDDSPPVDSSPSVRRSFAVVLRNRSVLVGGAVAFIAYSLYLFLNSWLPTYLVKEFALTTAASGLLAAVFPAMGVVSRAGGGVLSDRLFGHRRLPVLKWSLAVTTPVVVLLAVSTSITALVALLVVGGLVIQLTFGVVYSYVQEAVDPEMEGTALSVLGSAGIAGAFSAPIVAGTLIDLTGDYAAAFAYAVAMAIVGVGLVFAAGEP